MWPDVCFLSDLTAKSLPRRREPQKEEYLASRSSFLASNAVLGPDTVTPKTHCNSWVPPSSRASFRFYQHRRVASRVRTLLQFQDCEQKGPRFNGEDERARMCVLPAFVRTIVSVPCLLFGQRMLLASRASVTKAEESVTVVEDFALYSQTLETSYAIRRRNIFLLLKTIQFRYERMTREKLNFKVRFVRVARRRKHVKGRGKEKSEMGSLQDLSRYF